MQNLRPLSGRQKPRTSWPRSKGAVSDWKKSPQDAQNRKNAWRKPHKNMYSYLRDGTLGSSAFLAFLPMLPLQLLVQNLLYDLSQTTIPFDPVDAEDLAKPRRWEAQGIARFMLVLGPISSVFDLAT